jgi:hypothetical protein
MIPSKRNEQFLEKHFIKEDNSILYDNEPIFILNDDGSWSYVRNGEKEQLKKFNQCLFFLFLDDVVEQLINGADRNNLVMNIPKEIKIKKIEL